MQGEDKPTVRTQRKSQMKTMRTVLKLCKQTTNLGAKWLPLAPSLLEQQQTLIFLHKLLFL